jgi:hypothetical protein
VGSDEVVAVAATSEGGRRRNQAISEYEVAHSVVRTGRKLRTPSRQQARRRYRSGKGGSDRHKQGLLRHPHHLPLLLEALDMSASGRIAAPGNLEHHAGCPSMPGEFAEGVGIPCTSSHTRTTEAFGASSTSIVGVSRRQVCQERRRPSRDVEREPELSIAGDRWSSFASRVERRPTGPLPLVLQILGSGGPQGPALHRFPMSSSRPIGDTSTFQCQHIWQARGPGGLPTIRKPVSSP